jgi:hypothetical protein
MTVLAFLGALSVATFTFELISALQYGFFRHSRLDGAYQNHAQQPIRRSTWEAILIALFPKRFDPDHARDLLDVVALIRRAGYPYSTPGEFYAAAIREFSKYLVIGGLMAGSLAMNGMLVAAPLFAAFYIYLGLRRPYTRLKKMAKARAETMRNNMLIALSVLESLLSSGVGVQDALRRTAAVGGTFSNLLGLLVAQMEIKDIESAIEVVQAHLPDPGDTDATLFLADILDFFQRSRPILSSVTALRESVHRSVLELTEERAALVRQRSGLFGVTAVIGLVLSMVMPFLGNTF